MNEQHLGAVPLADYRDHVHRTLNALDDVLEIFEEFKPRFVKRYAHLARRFPAEEHCYAMEPGDRERFLASLAAGG